MSYLNPVLHGDSVIFATAECAKQGQNLREHYLSAQPYPSVVIDDFVPIEMLRRVAAEFPPTEHSEIADAHSLYKTGYTLERIKSVYITNLLYALHSAPFLTFLEEMTSIGGLIPDPYYKGGGLHETKRGGHLSIHADFNVQQKLGLIRRLNLILFINEVWREEYGGQLELWKRDMSDVARRILPIMGRAVVFNTDDDSYHGQPNALQSPDGIHRRSIALYYYTAPADGLDRIRPHSTQFRVRRGSADRYDFRTKWFETCRDWCPPVLWRLMSAKRTKSNPAPTVVRRTADLRVSDDLVSGD